MTIIKINDKIEIPCTRFSISHGNEGLKITRFTDVAQEIRHEFVSVFKSEKIKKIELIFDDGFQYTGGKLTVDSEEPDVCEFK